jgi:6-pyruvoyltetrahydropterin/6-carboxytetrahydropterin synthase
MKVCKIFQWDAAHKLILPYTSPCAELHGHTYKVEIEVEGDIDSHGMVIDFHELKDTVNLVSFDHKYLNELRGLRSYNKNPTAENLVGYLKIQLDSVWDNPAIQITRIRIWETPTSWAEESW